MKRLLILAALALAGCGTTEAPPKVITQIVNVPVPAKCEATVQRPGLIDAEAIRKDASKPDAEWVRSLMARDLQLSDYMAVMEAGLVKCGGTILPAAPK